MFPANLVLLGYFVPALIAAGAAVAGGWRRGGPLVVALGVGAAVVAGLFGVEPRPGFPPLEAWGWTHVGAAAAAGLSLLESGGRLPELLRWTLRLVLVQALVGLILHGLVPHALPIEGAALRWMVLELAVLAAWANLDAFAARERGPSLPIVLAVLGLTIAAGLIASASLRLGQLALVTTAVGAGWTLVALIRVDRSWEGVSLAALVTAWAALLLNGTFYADMPEVSVALFATAPALAWIARLGPIARLGGRWRALIAGGLVAVPSVVAVLWALRPSRSFE